MTRYQRCQQIIEGFRRDAIAQQEHNARMRATNDFWAALDALQYARDAAMYEDPQVELERRVEAARSAA